MSRLKLDGLKNEAIDIDRDTWYYEESYGLEIVHWHIERDKLRVPIHIRIGKGKILASAKRYMAKRAAKKKVGKR